MKLADLSHGEYHPYYQQYLDLLGETELIDALRLGLDRMEEFIGKLKEDTLSYSYGKDKWTVGEVLLHLVDTERIFQYRALRFARKDSTPLAGFDQDAFVRGSGAKEKNKNQILKEFKAVRNASIALFESFDSTAMVRIGTASEAKMSVRALGLMISAHQIHHTQLLYDRYLV